MWMCRRLLLSLLSFHLLKIYLSCHHHLIHQPSCGRQHLPMMKKQNPCQNKIILGKKIETGKTSYLVSTRNANIVCCQRWTQKKRGKEENKRNCDKFVTEKILRSSEAKNVFLDKNTQDLITGWMQIKPGAPTKVDNMELVIAIAKTAITGSAAHERRCSAIIWTVKFLERLVPQYVFSIEGKGHVNTVPVKLLHSENFKHSSHVGAMFAHSMIWHVEEVAGFLGPEDVVFHSQDDKANENVLFGYCYIFRTNLYWYS